MRDGVEIPDFQAYRGTEPPRFANQAELECAKLLDYYGVPWEYEPRTFVLEEDEDGRVAEAFTPDFYLPEQDLYLEITVMKQSLVTRKNRKLRKLRERYPERARSSSSTSATSSGWPSDFRLDLAVLEPSRPADRRGLPHRGGARRARARARREIARDYAGREPLLVALAEGERSSSSPTSRARCRSCTRLDFVELAGYGGGDDGRPRQIRLLKDLDADIARPRRPARRGRRRHRLTLHYLVADARAARARARSPSRRCSTGPTAGSSTTCPCATSASPCPDELFVGYGFDLDERYRNLPDLRLPTSRTPLSLG